jgi:hypothetical protein
MTDYTDLWNNASSRSLIPSPKKVSEDIENTRYGKNKKEYIIDLYNKIHSEIDELSNNNQSPVIDTDQFTKPEIKLLKEEIFSNISPEIASFFINIHPPAETQIKIALFQLKEKTITVKNFQNIKLYCRKLNDERWKRKPDDNERQGGVSVLGSLSETILQQAFDNLIDNKNFFKSTASQIQSYGDFVLMCLPNNLWLSVKSGYSRERLLASGFVNDVIGVGFFESSKEFTSLAKIRNFKKVGFIALYLPDEPVSEDQARKSTSTFHEVVSYYNSNKLELPNNINGSAFFRKLSQLGDDMEKLLNKKVSHRFTMDL